jgi:hypothetical protein
MLTCSQDRDAVLTHQPANTAVPDVQADLFHSSVMRGLP